MNVIHLFTLNELGNREYSYFNPQHPCTDGKLCGTIFRLRSFTNYAYRRDSVLLGFRMMKLDFGFDQTNLYEIPTPGVSLVKAWEIAWKFRKIE